LSTLVTHNAIALPSDQSGTFCGIASYHSFFYLTMPQACRVHRFDKSFQYIDSYRADRAYTYLCYDTKEACFWAVTATEHSTIYQLDHSFKEIDCIEIKRKTHKDVSITGISYDCVENTLLLSYPDCILEISKHKGSFCLLHEAASTAYVTVLSLAPYYAVIARKKELQELQIWSRDEGLLEAICIPLAHRVGDVLLHLYDKNKLELLLLTFEQHCRTKLIPCTVTCCGIHLSPCNDHAIDDEEEQGCPYDIIRSVAQIQTAIAHILNAEGEKLQKGITVARNVDELLALNDSVAKMITKAMQLEHVLYAKLEIAQELLKQ